MFNNYKMYSTKHIAIFVFTIFSLFSSILTDTNKNIPLVVITWDYKDATEKGISINNLFIKI